MSLQLKPRVAVRAKISAVGSYVPPRVMTNQDLEKLVDTTDQWILERTGIRERHIVDPGMATSDLATEAAKVCLQRRGIDASEIDCIIVGTVTPDMLFPATACLVQMKLGATKAWASTCPLPVRPSRIRCRSAQSWWKAARINACWSSAATP